MDAQLLNVCKVQHGALDLLLAMLAERDRDFLPSKSAAWPAVVLGAETLRRAESAGAGDLAAIDAQHDALLFDWLVDASRQAGDFLKNLAEAGLRADTTNYAVLRPVLLYFKTKYPKYAEAPAGRKR
jgi:hypothetical protein